MPRIRSLVLILGLSLASILPIAGCAAAKAPITAQPSIDQVQATRAMAIRVADDTRRGLVIARAIRDVAQEQSGAGKPITAAQMITINQKAVTLGRTLDTLLTVLESLSTQPELQSTKMAVLAAFTEFTKDLPNAGTLNVLVSVLLNVLVLVRQ